MKKILLLASVALSLASCASLDQRVVFKGVDPKLPVSASSSLFVDGKVIGEGDYRTIASIATTKTIDVPLKEKQGEIDIGPELEALVKKQGGDAVAKLKISIDDVDSSDYQWVYFERAIGAELALTGGFLLAFTGTFSSSTSVSSSQGRTGLLIGAGAVCAGGLALLGGSFIHEKYGKTTYSIGLNGITVKLPTE